APSTSAGFAALQETSRDPDLAAFFSHLADEGSTRIARPAPPPPPEHAAPPPTIASPIDAELEGTLTNAQFSEPGEAFEPDVSEVAWPTTQPMSFEAPPESPAEFAPTILAPAVSDEGAPAPASAP